MENIFSVADQELLVEAIRQAERQSSGEIRIHIDGSSQTEHAKMAMAVFRDLCQDKTAEKNAVLFHINFPDRYLTIIGDTGIHLKVKQEFWDRLHDEITAGFRAGNFVQALIDGIFKTGEELRRHFPISDADQNELSDEISFS